MTKTANHPYRPEAKPLKIHKSCDPTWVRWSVSVPGIADTQWFTTPQAAAKFAAEHGYVAIEEAPQTDKARDFAHSEVERTISEHKTKNDKATARPFPTLDETEVQSFLNYAVTSKTQISACKAFARIQAERAAIVAAAGKINALKKSYNGYIVAALFAAKKGRGEKAKICANAIADFATALNAVCEYRNDDLTAVRGNK